MRWHSDKPTPRLPRLAALRPVAPIDMERTDGPARAMLRAARRFYRRKLRAYAESRDTGAPK